MKHTSGLSITLAAILLLSGCVSLAPRGKEGAPIKVNASEISEGYALLYDLVSKEKQSSLLSIIKRESPELKSLLERISDTSKTTAKELETLARINPPLTLKVAPLPRIEQAARESIDRETSKEILHSNGVDLEFHMVSSQLAGPLLKPTHGEENSSNGPTANFPNCTARCRKCFLPATNVSGRTQIKGKGIRDSQLTGELYEPYAT